MTPETRNIPDWAQRERQADFGWIAENLDVFWTVATTALEDLGGALSSLIPRFSRYPAQAIRSPTDAVYPPDAFYPPDASYPIRLLPGTG